MCVCVCVLLRTCVRPPPLLPYLLLPLQYNYLLPDSIQCVGPGFASDNEGKKLWPSIGAAIASRRSYGNNEAARPSHYHMVSQEAQA